MRTLLCCRFSAFPIVSGYAVHRNVLADRLAARYRLRGRPAQRLMLHRNSFVNRISRAASGAIQKNYVTNIAVFPSIQLLKSTELSGRFLWLLRRNDTKQELAQLTDRLFQRFLRREQDYYRTKPTKAQELLQRYWGEQPPRLVRQKHAFPQAFPVLGALLSLPKPRAKAGPPLLHRAVPLPPSSAVPAVPSTEATVHPVLTERELRFVTQTVYAELERQLRGENLRRGR